MRNRCIVRPAFKIKRKPWLLSLGSKISLGGEPCLSAKEQQLSTSEPSGWYSGDAAAPCWPRPFPTLGIGFLGVSLAFGLTVLTMAYAIGHISGCHLNPAVSVGLCVGKRFPASELVPYMVAQVAGRHRGGLRPLRDRQRQGRLRSERRLRVERIRRAFARRLFAAGVPGGGNGADLHVPDGHPGRTDRSAPAGFAPIAIGLGLTLIHLIGIPVTNLSVNPARSTGPAIFVGGWALGQLWLFWVAPIIGGALGRGIYRAVFGEP